MNTAHFTLLIALVLLVLPAQDDPTKRRLVNEFRDAYKDVGRFSGKVAGRATLKHFFIIVVAVVLWTPEINAGDTITKIQSI